MNCSATKSSDQRSFGHCGTSIGARCPRPACDRPPADHEALLAIEPEQAFVVHREALRRSRTCRRR